MADTSLIFSIIARDKTTNVMKKIQMQASSTGALVAKALGPAITPVVGVATGGVLAMGAALASAGAAAGVFGAVTATAMTEVSEAATKVQDLNDKIELYGRQAEIMAARGENNAKMLDKQAKAALELKARLSLLPPETRRATIAFMDMKSGWSAFVETNKPATFNTLANGYRLIGVVIGKLQPFFDIGRAAADRLLASLDRMVAGGGIERLAANAGPAMASLTSIIINASTAATRMFGKFVGQGQGVLDWIEEATRKWAAWASASEQGTGINRFVEYVSTHGPGVIALLGSLASAMGNIAQAVAPLAPISLAVASSLAAIVAAIPPGVLTAFVAGWLAFNIALKAYAIYSAVATAAQWAMNVAMLANPITWIILAIVALIAVIVVIATKTTWFQTIWKHVWGFMKAVGAWFAGPFANFFVAAWNKILSGLRSARSGINTAINAIRAYYNGLLSTGRSALNWLGGRWDWFKNKTASAVSSIRSRLSGMFSAIPGAFRSAINSVIRGWNNLGFSIPSFSVFGQTFGGGHIGTPNIPYLATGGHVKQEGLAYIHRGETVTPAARVTPYRASSGGGGSTLVLRSDGSRLSNLLLEALREAIRERGGDPVKVLAAK